ncbi:MAG: hypothetical protein ACSLFR_03815, partial [Solirubrobacteraceae bacterium]
MGEPGEGARLARAGRTDHECGALQAGERHQNPTAPTRKHVVAGDMPAELERAGSRRGGLETPTARRARPSVRRRARSARRSSRSRGSSTERRRVTSMPTATAKRRAGEQPPRANVRPRGGERGVGVQHRSRAPDRVVGALNVSGDAVPGERDPRDTEHRESGEGQAGASGDAREG